MSTSAEPATVGHSGGDMKFCFYDTEYAVRMVNERELVTLQLHHF